MFKDATIRMFTHNLELFKQLNNYPYGDDGVAKNSVYGMIIMTHELLRLEAEAEIKRTEFDFPQL